MVLEHDDGQTFDEPRTGMSTGAKIAIGCSVTLVAAIVLCVGAGYFAYRHFKAEAEAFLDPYIQQGYVRSEGQAIELREPVTTPTAFFAQSVAIHNGATADLAIAAQVATIDGTVEGNIAFYGQMLHIRRGAIVTGNIDIAFGQVIEVDGTVEGSITGQFQTIQTGPSGSVDGAIDAGDAPEAGAPPPDTPDGAADDDDDAPGGAAVPPQ